MRKQSSLAKMKTGSNIIPIINVAFIIILILMLISPFLGESRIKIDLPESQSSEVQEEHKISITISNKGRLEIEDQHIEFSELAEYLNNRIALDLAQILVIRADKNVSYRWVRRVIETGRACGVAKIAIATEPKEASAELEE